MNKYEEMNNLDLLLALKDFWTIWGPTMDDAEYEEEAMKITLAVFLRMDKERRYK